MEITECQDFDDSTTSTYFRCMYHVAQGTQQLLGK